ncbi:F-box/LRR-repeat protein [Trifolium repens]|nr:F-box/LRR-repeat protein [Trifolium repens]
MIQTKTRKGKHGIEISEDKLSNLPNCILVHILSFLNTKDAVRTCILSKRWKHIWKYIPTLTLHYSNFSTLKSFDKFVSSVLCLRDNSLVLHAIDFHRNSSIASSLLIRVAFYVLLHNFKLLRLGIDVKGDIGHIMPCISACQTLTSLKLSISPKGRYNFGRTLFPKSLNFPALTFLHLGNFAFCAGDDGRIEPFSLFNKLNSLIIDNCTVKDAQIMCISSETLISLTMRNHSFDVYQIELSAPSLCTFSFMGTPYQKFRGRSLSSVKQVNIDAEMLANYSEPPLVLLSWLSDVANINSLTVSASTLQVLSFVPGFFKDKLLPSSFIRSLKSLKVILKPLSYGLSMALKIVMLEKELKAGLEPVSLIPDGILDILLQNSPSADVDIVESPRIDDSFNHLAPLSSSLYLEFLQPSSNEHVLYDLERRIQHLKKVEVQTNKYVDLAKEAIVGEREELLSLKEHTMMLSNTVNLLEPQVTVVRIIMSNNTALEIMIPPNLKRGRCDDEDRLSDLSARVLLHILSFLHANFVVQTCVLSPRWKFLWKTIPTLILHSSKFSVNGEICPILRCVSSCRALTSLKLFVYPKDRYGGKTLFPKSLNLPALTNLELDNFTFCASDNAECAEPYTAFNSLSSLTICYCSGRDALILSISNATLVNLTNHV